MQGLLTEQIQCNRQFDPRGLEGALGFYHQDVTLNTSSIHDYRQLHPKRLIQIYACNTFRAARAESLRLALKWGRNICIHRSHKKSAPTRLARFFQSDVTSVTGNYFKRLFLMSLRPSRVLSQVFSTLALTSSQRALLSLRSSSSRAANS